jgi:hypothetical protein
MLGNRMERLQTTIRHAGLPEKGEIIRGEAVPITGFDFGYGRPGAGYRVVSRRKRLLLVTGRVYSLSPRQVLNQHNHAAPDPRARGQCCLSDPRLFPQ